MEDARRGSLLHAPSGRQWVGDERVGPTAPLGGSLRGLSTGKGRSQRRHHRPTTVRCRLACRRHFDRPGGPPATRSGRSRVPQSSRPCCTDPAGRRDALACHARDRLSRPDDRPPVSGAPSGEPTQETHALAGAPRGASARARHGDSSPSRWLLNACHSRFGATIANRDRTSLFGTATAFGPESSPEPGPGNGFWICGSGSRPSGSGRAKRRSSRQIAQAGCTNGHGDQSASWCVGNHTSGDDWTTRCGGFGLRKPGGVELRESQIARPGHARSGGNTAEGSGTDDTSTGVSQ